MPKTVIVVPCYNEAQRLDPTAFEPLVASPDVHLLFVDDGSTDGTRPILDRAQARLPDRVEVLGLARNQGKAEAVRRGLIQALAQEGSIVGFLDADLSTPAIEMYRLIGVLRESTASVVLGARVRLLGYTIVRSPLRHYLGRVFGTFASIALRLSVYDTQCGAKLFRDTAALRAALEKPFLSRWAFDVELIGRLTAPVPPIVPMTAADFLEVPLQVWTDVPGSKLRPSGMLRAGMELSAIALRQGRLRRQRLDAGTPTRQPHATEV